MKLIRQIVLTVTRIESKKQECRFSQNIETAVPKLSQARL